jgi:hypothetical protein
MMLFMSTNPDIEDRNAIGPAASILIGAVVCCAAAVSGDNMQVERQSSSPPYAVLSPLCPPPPSLPCLLQICCVCLLFSPQDLKSGHLVGATPYKQQIMQLIGVIVPGLLIAPSKFFNLIFSFSFSFTFMYYYL